MSKDVVLNKELWKIAQKEFNQSVEQPVLPFANQLGKDIDESNEVWNKAHQDYELLKVGNENLLNGGKAGLPIDYWLTNRNLMLNYRQSDNFTEFLINGDLATYGEQFDLNKDNRYIKSLFIEVSKPCQFNIWTTGHETLEPNKWTRVSINRNERLRMSFREVEEGTVVRFNMVKIELSPNSNNAPTPWTPSYKDIDAHPMAIELAKSYQKRQQEINELRNAIISGGGKL